MQNSWVVALPRLLSSRQVHSPSHPVFGASSAASGGLYTDGELVSGDISKCEHSDAGAPIEDVQNLLLKVGQHQGCVEVRGAGRLLVV